MKGVENQSNSTDDKIKSFLKWNRHTVKKKKKYFNYDHNAELFKVK